MKKTVKRSYGTYQNVKLTDDEYTRLVNDLGQKKLDFWIGELDLYIEDFGDKYKTHNVTIRRWENRKSNQASSSYTNSSSSYIRSDYSDSDFAGVLTSVDA